VDHETAAVRVLDAAESLFYARGVQAVGMDDIRAAAGVSLRRLYQVFPSKERLVDSYLARRDLAQRTAMIEFVGAVDEPEERILAVFDFLALWFAHPDFRGCALANCFGELGPGSPTVAAAAREHKQGLREYLATLTHQAGLGPALSGQLALLVEGAITTAAILGGTEAAVQARQAAAILVTAARTDG
jgi:AcrR family transcriptional regulator